MKMQDALDIIHNKPKGFMVHLEWDDGRFLRTDYFPNSLNSKEELIPTEWEAWELAERFAKATKGRTRNLYVVDASFNPVKGYEQRKILNYQKQPDNQNNREASAFIADMNKNQFWIMTTLKALGIDPNEVKE